MSKPKITLYLDVVSPFTYIAYHITRTSPAFQKCDITYIPIFLGGVMSATGNQTPLNIKSPSFPTPFRLLIQTSDIFQDKATWLDRQRLRFRQSFRVPMSEAYPSPFPQPTIRAQRALCAVATAHPESLVAALDALYAALWVEGRTVDRPEVYGAALAGVFGEAAAGKLVEASAAEPAKAALRANTERALAEGCFGLPWFVATNLKGATEGFWGVDHIGHLLDFVGVAREGVEGFRALL